MASKLISNNTAINTQYENIITPVNINLLNDNIKSIIQNEIKKINSIDEQILKLSNIKTIVKNSQKLQEILSKYITFLKYIKKIIQIKIIKDITIVKLINDVFEKVNVVIEKTNGANYGKYTPITNNTKKNELKQLRKSKKSKIYLVDIGNIEYKNNITQLENCTESIKTELNTAIREFNAALQPIEGGAPKNTYSLNDETKPFYNALTTQTEKVFEKINSVNNTIGATELNNKKVELMNKHTQNLVSIKQKYEEGLQTNIADFENICSALKELINKIKEITGILSNKKLQVITLNQDDEKELQRQIDALTKEPNPVTIKGLKISDFKDANIFTRNHIALVGEEKDNGKGGLLGEIIKEQNDLRSPPQNTSQGIGTGQQQQQQQQINQRTNQGQNIGNLSQGNPGQGQTASQVVRQDNAASQISNVSSIYTPSENINPDEIKRYLNNFSKQQENIEIPEEIQQLLERIKDDLIRVNEFEDVKYKKKK